jgi:hypothetical protein
MAGLTTAASRPYSRHEKDLLAQKRTRTVSPWRSLGCSLGCFEHSVGNSQAKAAARLAVEVLCDKYVAALLDVWLGFCNRAAPAISVGASDWAASGTGHFKGGGVGGIWSQKYEKKSVGISTPE